MLWVFFHLFVSYLPVSLGTFVHLLSSFSPVQLFATLWTLGRPPGSSVHGILQARILEEVAMPSSVGYSHPGIKLASPAIYLWTAWEASLSGLLKPCRVRTLVSGVKPHSVMHILLFCHSVMSDSLWPHGLQHARLPCPSSSPRVCSNSCPLSQWCHPTVSSSVVPFSSCLRSSPELGSFLMSQLFASVGQSTGASTSTSILPMNIQDCFPLGLTGWISFLSKGLSRVFSSTTVRRHQFFEFF